ncbi:hypothetical protein FQN60_001141 [Etheostoma spectabile]|uniref:Uncharacterized protein n=1 Tax=Etheostoma spectabile TaxID=54343 RepID=A0A5J5D1U4_9PERO|nr:hypothetical protein FQN60_001141 [Etheostoma spectabile]
MQRKGVERYTSPCPCKVLRAVEAAAKNLALQSRLCDRTRIGEYHPGAVRYTQADLVDLSDDDDDGTNVLFYSPDMTLKDRGP